MLEEGDKVRPLWVTDGVLRPVPGTSMTKGL